LGETGLFGGPRVSKDHPRIEAYGTVDELNATLGLARSFGDIPDLDPLLQRIQSELFEVGAELATPKPSAHGTALMGSKQIEFLEQSIDTLESEL
jgi:cob(I)alamin adenosyltransferase